MKFKIATDTKSEVRYIQECLVRVYFSNWLHSDELLCNKQLIHMDFDMLFERSLVSVSLIALITLEQSLHSVYSHVLLQSIRSSASIVTLVTFERLFSRVLSHRVNFQFYSGNARVLARCASVWLFSRVRLLVPLQVA